MIFTELVIENFGAYAGKHTINLRPEADGRGPGGLPHERPVQESKGIIQPIILLGGMNGGGKTTLMDAIRLALYGQRARCSTRGNLGYGDFLTQSVNSQAKQVDLTQIQLSFEHIFEGHWQQFKIIRAWQKNPQDGKDSLSIERESRFDSNLEQYWDEYVENILPLGISNLFLFDGEQVKELAELDTPPAAVVEAINNLLGLELAEKLSLDLEVLVNRKRKALANKTQLLTIEETENKLAAKQAEKTKINDKLTELQLQLEQANKKCDRARHKFNQQGGKIASKREQVEAKLKDFNSQLEAKRQELITLASGYLPLKLITPLLSAAVNQAKEELKIQQFKQAQGVLAARDRKLLNYLTSISLPDESISKVEFFIDQENKQIANSIENEAASFLHLTELELQQLIIKTQDILPLQTKSTENVIQQLQQLEAEKERTESQLAIAASPEDYQQLLQAVENTQQEVSNCKALYQIEQEKSAQLDREIERIQQELNRKLKNYSDEAIDNINDEHIIKTSAKVQKTLKLFKEKLTLKKLNKLETEVKDCFLYLLHKSNLINRVTIDSDRFKLELYDHQGQLFPKQRLSAGEKQLLAIAFLWGLARVSGRNLPIAIDTPLGRLDSSHRHNLVERYFPSASHQVILLSTDTEIGEKEVKLLREQDAIAHEYLLKYNPEKRQTTVEKGYFW
ncbi:DNA sulfur modification protein DndD [Pleurocapsa sp. CCALA 161]|uniref:DNA sulfur modification protein DndD n=1 Tax=Pleurocapsa sp. CCALA 161 TaxID=2107688 RepID=UPI000D04D74F|nr:DNA sulfur modification protein DndD [Pleurocapsa sp. CCALA 161]PSB10965.1 DNA sulfur modification protein DndD [Pleurocapsa sp. CCALA 161]